jgi:DNA polymerase-3 subunit delta
VTPGELARELAKGRIRPAYLLAGAEALLRDDALTGLREAVLGAGPSDFDFDRLDGDRLQPAQLLDAVSALPVLAPRRLVLVREPATRRGRADAAAEAIAQAVAALVDQDQAVLVVVASQVDKRSRWVKAFADPAALVACDPPKGAKALVGFVADEARLQELTLESGAAELLVELTGPQLLLLRSELEKAALFAGPGQPISRAHVAETACGAAEAPIWDLTDAIGEGRVGDALDQLNRLLGSGTPAPVLLGSLAGHFRKLTRAGHGGTLQGHPFAVRKLQTQARRYSAARLHACLAALQEVDEVLKGQGNVPASLALERVVMGLAA